MRSTAYTSTYALSTHRIWSSVVWSPVLIAGIATLTIVVSSRIMKNPVVRTSSTSQGLVRARAMSPPETFKVGNASDSPLQPSVVDLFLQVADPFALRVEHRDLVFELDQREAAQPLGAKVGQDVVELFGGRLQGERSIRDMRRGLRRAQVMHEHETSGKVRILTPRV